MNAAVRTALFRTPARSASRARGFATMPPQFNPNFWMRQGVKIAPWAAAGGLLGGWVIWPALPQLFPDTFGPKEE
jgi:hypothetical protein